MHYFVVETARPNLQNLSIIQGYAFKATMCTTQNAFGANYITWSENIALQAALFAHEVSIRMLFFLTKYVLTSSLSYEFESLGTMQVRIILDLNAPIG